MWILLSLFSAVFSAICAVLQKKALFEQEPFSFSMALYAIESSIFICALALAGGGDIFAISAANIGVIYIKSIFNVLSFVLIMTGLKRLDLSLSLPFLLLSPAVIAIAAYSFLGEKITARASLGIILIVAGGYLLQFKSLRDLSAPLRNIIRERAYALIFGAMAIVAFAALLNRYVLTATPVKPLTFIALDHLFAFLNMMIVCIALRRPFSNILSAVRISPVIIPSIASGTAAYRFFEIAATAEAPVALVVSLKRTSVIFAVALGGKLFREAHLAQRILATLFMVAGAALVAGF